MNHPQRSINGRNRPHYPVVRYVVTAPLCRHENPSIYGCPAAVGEIAAITAKRGGNRTDIDDRRLRELGCQRSLYLDADGRPTLPEAALRALIEASARKTKQGPAGARGVDD